VVIVTATHLHPAKKKERHCIRQEAATSGETIRQAWYDTKAARARDECDFVLQTVAYYHHIMHTQMVRQIQY
jgi:hypothetical protein